MAIIAVISGVVVYGVSLVNKVEDSIRPDDSTPNIPTIPSWQRHLKSGRSTSSRDCFRVYIRSWMEKQRTAIGVAALRDAEVLIFDEPTSGLDYKNMESVAGILSALSKRGKAILVISHDNELLMKVCSRIIRVDERTSS